jgi:hypothetical protein
MENSAKVEVLRELKRTPLPPNENWSAAKVEHETMPSLA